MVPPARRSRRGCARAWALVACIWCLSPSQSAKAENGGDRETPPPIEAAHATTDAPGGDSDAAEPAHAPIGGDGDRSLVVPAPECADATLSEDERAFAERALSVIEDQRGLPIRQPVMSCTLPREQLRDRFIALFERDADFESLEREGELLKMLGVFEPDTDILELVVTLLEEEVVGYFDPFVERLYVIPTLSSAVDRVTIAHELVHAAQDQSFPLRPYLDPSLLISDRSLARSALIEGDATLAGMFVNSGLSEWGELSPAFARRLAYTMWRSDPVMRGAGGYLQRSLLSSYAFGVEFVHALRGSGGWPAVDEAFRTPPASGEQVMHPERYLSADAPTWLEFGSLSPLCESRDYVDIRGEFDMRNILVELLDADLLEERFVAATDGWDGDRLELWKRCPNDARLLLHGSVWDSASDAREYAAAASEAFGRWACGESAEATIRSVAHASGHGDRHYAFCDARGVVIERWGDQVVVGLTDGIGAVSAEEVTGAVSYASRTLRRYAYPPAVDGVSEREVD